MKLDRENIKKKLNLSVQSLSNDFIQNSNEDLIFNLIIDIVEEELTKKEDCQSG